jgi:hypothetical protein
MTEPNDTGCGEFAAAGWADQIFTTCPAFLSGYDKAAISYYAIDQNQTLKQAALANGVSEELYDRVIDPLALTRPAPAQPTPRPAPGTPDITAPETP